MKLLLLLLLLLLLIACEKPQPPKPEPLPPSKTPVSVGELTKGFTLDNTENLPKIISAIKALNYRPTVRVVCDYPEKAASYKNAVDELSKIAEVIIQPADSTYTKKMSVEQYKARFADYINTFPQVNYFESGNEISGDWNSKDIIKQTEEATKLIKAAGKKSVLVVYWNTKTCADSNGEYLQWLKNNVTQYLKDNSDHVLLSVYGYDCDGQEPTYTQLDRELDALQLMFPKSKIAIGEYGKENNHSMIRHYLNYPRVGTGLYWFGYQAIIKNKNDWIEFSR